MDGGVRFVRLPSLSLLLGWPDDLSLTGTSDSRVEVSLQRLQTSSSVVQLSVCLQRHFVFFCRTFKSCKKTRGRFAKAFVSTAYFKKESI